MYTPLRGPQGCHTTPDTNVTKGASAMPLAGIKTSQTLWGDCNVPTWARVFICILLSFFYETSIVFQCNMSTGKSTRHLGDSYFSHLLMSLTLVSKVYKKHLSRFHVLIKKIVTCVLNEFIFVLIFFTPNTNISIRTTTCMPT